ncbi:MAG TPA: NapC/NirT family cytochrome c [Verrucomicrobiae bacterium]|nr:NapC/NirT family cytochrome c [Verrucomicrobiae bacterium]
MQKTLKRVIIVLGVLLIIAIGTAATFIVTSTPQFCANCHEISPMVTSWQQFSHNKVGCLHCHAEPGFGGYVKRKIGGLNEVYKHFTGQVPQALNPRITQQTCISCHNGSQNFPGAANVFDPSFRPQKVNFPHTFHLEMGQDCMKCHKSIVHGIEPKNPERNTNKINFHPICSTCHAIKPPGAQTDDANSWEFSDTCAKCHPADPRKK